MRGYGRCGVGKVPGTIGRPRRWRGWVLLTGGGGCDKLAAGAAGVATAGAGGAVADVVTTGAGGDASAA
jgi:hypothetical protein